MRLHRAAKSVIISNETRNRFTSILCATHADHNHSHTPTERQRDAHKLHRGPEISNQLKAGVGTKPAIKTRGESTVTDERRKTAGFKPLHQRNPALAKHLD